MKPEHKYHPSEAELRQDATANKVHKALEGKLSYTTEEWLRKRGKEQWRLQ